MCSVCISFVKGSTANHSQLGSQSRVSRAPSLSFQLKSIVPCFIQEITVRTPLDSSQLSVIQEFTCLPVKFSEELLSAPLGRPNTSQMLSKIRKAFKSILEKKKRRNSALCLRLLFLLVFGECNFPFLILVSLLRIFVNGQPICQDFCLITLYKFSSVYKMK